MFGKSNRNCHNKNFGDLRNEFSIACMGWDSGSLGELDIDNPLNSTVNQYNTSSFSM